MVEQFVHKGRV